MLYLSLNTHYVQCVDCSASMLHDAQSVDGFPVVPHFNLNSHDAHSVDLAAFQQNPALYSHAAQSVDHSAFMPYLMLDYHDAQSVYPSTFKQNPVLRLLLTAAPATAPPSAASAGCAIQIAELLVRTKSPVHKYKNVG